MRCLEPTRVLVADWPPLAMHRRVACLAQHARDRLDRHAPAEEPLELGTDLRRPHRRMLLLVVEDRLDLVLAEPGAGVERCARRSRHRRLRRLRRRARGTLNERYQTALLALGVPPPQRLCRATDRLRDLLALHPGHDQRQRTRVLRGREPLAPRRDARATSAITSTTSTRFRDSITRTDHERLLTGTAGRWRPPLRRPDEGRDLRICRPEKRQDVEPYNSYSRSIVPFNP
jgi:hypothetical protein